MTILVSVVKYSPCPRVIPPIVAVVAVFNSNVCVLAFTVTVIVLPSAVAATLPPTKLIVVVTVLISVPSS